jgi:DNA repair photolyase
VIAEFSKRGIDTGVLMMPIIPCLTDDIKNLDEIFRISKNNGAKSIRPQILHLRGNTKKVFFSHIVELFPGLSQKINAIYKGSYADKNYLDNFRIKISSLRNQYDFYNKTPSYCSCKKQPTQLTLI